MSRKNVRSGFLVILILACTCILAQNNSQLREIHVDASQVEGTIRSFQGVNGVPTPIMAGLPDLTEQYKALHIDVIRTHDTMGPTDVSAQFSNDNPLLAWLVPDNSQRAKIVAAGNAANLFPDWNADPDKPESYNFGPTDKVIEGIRATGADVYYRIGRSWAPITRLCPISTNFRASLSTSPCITTKVGTTAIPMQSATGNSGTRMTHRFSGPKLLKLSTSFTKKLLAL